MKFFNLGKIKE